MRAMDQMLGAGIGSSSGLNFGQSNGIPDELYNRLNDQMINGEIGSNENHHDEDLGEQNRHPNLPHMKKKHKHHSRLQLDYLKASFDNCEHPNENERKKMADDIGLDPQQIKNWFQNKRTQIKALDMKKLTTLLREENVILTEYNMILWDTYYKSFCSQCIVGNPQRELSVEELNLLLENSKLKEKLQEIMEKIAKSQGKAPLFDVTKFTPPLTLLEPSYFQQPITGEKFGPVSALVPVPGPTVNETIRMIPQLVEPAMQEFVHMARMDSPLWILDENNSFVLNEMEYLNIFPNRVGPIPTGFRSEASKVISVVKMSPDNLVKIFMDERQWSSVFSSIVSRAETVEVLSLGDKETHHRTLHLMNAEFQVLSPLVKIQENKFLRYCHNHSVGSWTVTDFSWDNNLQPNNSLMRCQRNPSGCLIEEMPGGYSKVTWIEHVEVDDQDHPHLYTSFENCGLAFGASRWISILKRHCEDLARAITIEPPLVNIPNGSV